MKELTMNAYLYPTTKEVVFKFIGVTPAQLAKLHRIVEESVRDRLLNPEQKGTKGEHSPPEKCPWIKIVRSQLSDGHKTYLVELSIDTFADRYSQSGSTGKEYELARLHMITALFEALNIFPDSDEPVFLRSGQDSPTVTSLARGML